MLLNTRNRLIALALAAFMLLGLAACGQTGLDETLGQIADIVLEEAAQEAPEEELALLPQATPEEAPDQTPDEVPEEAPEEVPEEAPALDPDGWYTSKEDVALYLHLYGTLPPNFITKNEARALGWSGGGLDGYADGMSIGGDRFGNYEGLLPDGDWRECDINTMHASKRGAERIIYSSDGRIYYTDDHYESFTLLYGEE